MDKYLLWIKQHERLILAFMAVALLAWGLMQWRAVRERELQTQFDEKKAELDAAKATAAAAHAETVKATTASQMVDTNALRVIASLQAQILERDKELAARQSSVASLSDQQLANRWATLTGLGSSELLPQSSGGLSASHTAAVVTVQQLESIPVLSDKVEALSGVINQREGQISAKNDLINSLQKESAADKVTLGKAEAACQAQVKLEVQKEHDKKEKGSWLWRGAAFVLGVLAGKRL